MGITSAEALYVGDMPIDADAGARAGVRVVLVSGGSSPDDVLRATGCRLLPALTDILDLLPFSATQL
jgi:phosphoglycolate phosphatase-like HAD superfamily hydrolase